MSKDKLKSIIDSFSMRGFISFFRQKSSSFAESYESLEQYDDDWFADFIMIGEIRFDDSADRLLILGARVLTELTEKTGKKAQYDKAKKILKDLNLYNAGIFIFCDNANRFRFSLIYEQAIGTKRAFSGFRRFTYFVSPEFTNRTFLQQIGEGDFSSLDKIRDSFSVEKVNKEFYSEIAKFFYEMTGSEIEKGSKTVKYDRIMRLPVSGDKKIYQELAVRLIGRIIFCWFLKYKKSPENIPLIPDKVLSSKAVERDYYHSVLEKLFFEVLNTPQNERKKSILAGSDEIPFLNGGLFEPHQHDFYNGNPLYSLFIPDEWFKELLGLLEQYNFTIDENSIVDVEISVDPEMLGRIFENLLAEINPETGKTARKATGSYYTPRPIVEYMVDESLKQCLLTKTGIDAEKIANLLSYETSETDLNEEEKDSIIKALDEIKVIDPACGSGAFPMGILQKMLLILQKVDPESKKWLGKQLDRIENEFFKKEIEEKLKNENWDYVHKLGIIQNSIYGVDIQPIAVEISRLRFFLSLIVDEKVDDNKPNSGVEPLPNLEFKFVSANSLIGLGNQPILETAGEFERLRELRIEYLNSRGEKKRHIEEEFRAIQKKMFQRSIQLGGKDSPTLKIASWNPFSNEASGWFDPEWMFGIKDGFDIVIANPPYGVDFKKELLKILESEFNYYDKQKNSASFFIELATELANDDGIISYIVPKSLSFSEGWKKTRDFITKVNRLHALIDVSQAFEEVLLEQIIIVYKKSGLDEYEFQTGEGWKSKVNIIGKTHTSLVKELDIIPVYADQTKLKILGKMKQNSILLSKISDTSRGLPYQSRLSETGVPILRGRNVTKYSIYRDFDSIILTLAMKRNKKVSRILLPKIISQRIVAHVLNPTDRIIIMATIDRKPYLTLDTVMNTILRTKQFSMEYIVALLNSRLAEWFFYWFVYNRAIRTMDFDKYYIGKLPVPTISTIEQNSFNDIVSQILSITNDSGYLADIEKQSKVKEYEHQIDKMVYRLYNLTPEEIAIVEGRK